MSKLTRVGVRVPWVAMGLNMASERPDYSGLGDRYVTDGPWQEARVEKLAGLGSTL